MRTISKIILLSLLFISQAAFSSILIVKDTTIVNEKGIGTYDSVIIGKNGRLYTSSLNLQHYMQLDSGGQLIGYPDYCWLAIEKSNAVIINHSSDTAFKSVQLSLRASSSNTYLKGQYIIEFDKIFSGWVARDVTLETNVKVNGSVFNGFANVIYLNGYDLILGEDAVFEKLPLGQVVLMVDPVKGGRVKKLIRNGLNTLIPFGDKFNGMAMRTDVNFVVNSSSVLGSNPAVIFEMFANDSLPLAPDKILGTATKDYLKRWLRIKFQNVSSPDITVRLNEAENGVDTVGVPSNYFCALWDGAKWNYQNPYNTYYKFTEWYNLTQQEAILSAGRDLGMSTATCNYQPTSIRFKNVADNSAYMLWDKASSTDKKYNIKLRQKGTSLWTSFSANTNLDTLSGLTASTNYEVKIQTVCQNNDTSAFTAVKAFYTSVPNYDAATNTYSLSTYDTIPSFIEYTTININSGGVGVVVDDIRALTFLQIYGGGTLYLDDHYLYGTATPRFYNNSTLRYSQKYLKGSYDSPFRTGKTAAVQAAVSFILNGNNAEGQFIDAAYLSTLNNLTIDARNKVYISRLPITVNGTFTLKNGIVEDLSGKIYLGGDSLIIHDPDAIINASTSITSVDYVIAGDYPVQFKNFSVGINETDPLKKVTLNNDIDVTGTFSLLNGSLVLNNNNLSLNEITKDAGTIIGENGGTVILNVEDYSGVSIPFGNSVGDKLTTTFNLVAGSIGPDATLSLTMMDEPVSEKNTAPHDYLSRYLEIGLSDISNPVYNISFAYDSSSDVVGKESFMENELYTGSQWLNSMITVDSVNHEVYWERLTETGKLTAGNFMGYANAKPIELESTEITTDGVSFTWKFPDEGVDNWTIKYKPTAAPTWNKVTTIDTTFKRISGILSPGTAYQWYVLTNQTAGYAFIDSSAIAEFTTRTGTCNQPVSFNYSNQKATEVTLSWAEGSANYTLDYKKHGESWASAISISAITGTSKTLTGLEKQTQYVARVRSSCGSYSDSLIFHTSIRGLVDNVLIIDTVQDIPAAMVFDKIIVKGTGYAVVKANTTFLDSLIIEQDGTIEMGDYMLEGFVFAADSLAVLKIGHPNGLVDDDNTNEVQSKGNVQTTVRDYNTYTIFNYNGTVPQQMSFLFSTPYTNSTQALKYLVIDNPTRVKCNTNLSIGESLTIEQGKIEFPTKYNKLTLESDVILANNAGENALNDGNCYLIISGGGEGLNNGSIIQGSAVTYADTVVQKQYDEAYIKSDLRVGKYLGLAKNFYYYGIRVIGARLIIDPGATIETNGTRIMLMDTIASIRFNIDNSVIDSFIYTYIGDNSYILPVEFKVKSGSVPGPNAYLELKMYLQKHSSVTAPSYIKRYYKISANDISNLSYNFTSQYLNTEVVGTESQLRTQIRYSDWRSGSIPDFSGNFFGAMGITQSTIVTAFKPACILSGYSFGNDTTLCKTAILDAGAGYSLYSWKNNEGTSRYFSASSQGDYWVYVRDNSQCEGFDTIKVTSGTPPATSEIMGDNNPANNTFENYGVIQTPGSTYQWSVKKGTIMSGQGTNYINVFWSTQGIDTMFVIETTQQGCIGDTIKKIIFNDVPVNSNSPGQEEMAWCYPNPVQDLIHINLNLTEEADVTISLYSADGVLLFTLVEEHLSKGNKLFTRSLNRLSPGTYLLKIRNASNVYCWKVIKV